MPDSQLARDSTSQIDHAEASLADQPAGSDGLDEIRYELASAPGEGSRGMEHASGSGNELNLAQTQNGSTIRFDGGGLDSNCPGNEAYQSIVERAARRIYDPSQLGDLDRILNPAGCYRTEAEGIRAAGEVLKGANDPYTKVIEGHGANKRDWEKILEGKVIGVGIDVQRTENSNKGPYVVEQVFPGSPAAQAGIEAGDVIMSVNGVSTKTLKYNDTVDLFRNTAGKNIRLGVMRDGLVWDMDMRTEEMEIPAVTHRELDGGDLAYIKIDTFIQRDTAEELQAAIQQYPDAKGFVFDLRDNTGGLLDEAVQAAGLVVDNGKVMSMRQREDSDPRRPTYEVTSYELTDDNLVVTLSPGDSSEDTVKNKGRLPDLVDKPIVLLLNKHSASASEIFASALSENDEAVVFGTRSYGKGIGQTVFSDLPGGTMLSVRSFRYFSADGNWFGDAHKTRTGIVPDSRVTNTDWTLRGSSNDHQLNTALAYLRRRTNPFR